MLIGTDTHHTVVFEQAKDQWSHRGLDGTKQPIADSLAANYLDEKLTSSSSRDD